MRAARPVDFSPLAGVYAALEVLAFGRGLEAARFHFLGEFRAAGRLLVLGDGDGRGLARLLAAAPRARVVALDVSPGMVARAARRIPARDRGRVTFLTGDARTTPLPPGPFDGVVTCFFLDCFTAADVAGLIARVQPALAPEARWLWVDFARPAAGWRRWRARAWLAVLYPVFGYTTGLAVRSLPPAEELLAAAGFRPGPAAEFNHGLLRAVVFRPAPGGPR